MSVQEFVLDLQPSHVGSRVCIRPPTQVRGLIHTLGCITFGCYLMVLTWHCIDAIENKNTMQQFLTQQCMNNKLLLLTHFLLTHGDVALTNDMLIDYKVAKVYEYFFNSGCRRHIS
jgi:hypothetical protein